MFAIWQSHISFSILYKHSVHSINMNVSDEEHLKMLLNSDPSGHFAVSVGALFCQSAQYKRATKYFNEVLKLHPEHEYALHMKISALLQDNKYPEAITYIDKWIQITTAPDFPYVYKGQALLCLNQWKTAKEYFELGKRSLYVTPDFPCQLPASFFSYAFTLFKTENYKESLQNCNKMLNYKIDKKSKKNINILKKECYKKLNIKWWNFLQKYTLNKV